MIRRVRRVVVDALLWLLATAVFVAAMLYLFWPRRTR